MSGVDLAIIALLVLAVVTSYVLLDRLLERRNIETLRDRLDLDREPAERLYALARRDGFGSAYREVLGDADRTARPSVRPAASVAGQCSSEAPRGRG
jgi:hypothetical protein